MGDNTSDKEEIQCDKHKLNGYFNRDVVAGHHATHAREEDREREKLRRDAAAAKKAIRDRNEAWRNKKNGKDNSKNGKDSSKNKAQSSGPSLSSPYPTIKSTRYEKNCLE